MMDSRAKKIRAFRRNQPIEELARKADKAYRRKGQIWTLEEIEFAESEAVTWCDKLGIKY